MNPALTLPPACLITPEPPAGVSFDGYLAQLERCLEGGVRLVQFRAKTLDPAGYAELAAQVRACCLRYQARLLLNAPAAALDALDADGVHLTSTRLMACTQRPLPAGKLLSVACHDARQVRHANHIGADSLTLSPVLPTATHPDATPLGWARFQALASLSRIPVYAMGGMSMAHLEQARAAGAHGIAAIRALWNPAEPDRLMPG